MRGFGLEDDLGVDVDGELIEGMALRLHEARVGRRAIAQLTTDTPTLSAAAGAAIAAMGHQLREDDGERAIGWKLGLTSRAKMVQVGVHQPIRGRLYDAMRLDDGATVDPAAYCHPRVEPEVAFVMARDVAADASAAEALSAVGLVLPGLEVIDSRYRDFRFTLPDVIADNTSAAAFVLGGPGRTPRDLTAAGLAPANLGVIFEVDGEAVAFASTAAILDGPQHALAALVRSLAAEGQQLRRGDVVLAGAPVAAVPLAGVRSVRVQIEGLGEASLRVGGRSGP